MLKMCLVVSVAVAVGALSYKVGHHAGFLEAVDASVAALQFTDPDGAQVVLSLKRDAR